MKTSEVLQIWATSEEHASDQHRETLGPDGLTHLHFQPLFNPRSTTAGPSSAPDTTHSAQSPAPPTLAGPRPAPPTLPGARLRPPSLDCGRRPRGGAGRVEPRSRSGGGSAAELRESWSGVPGVSLCGSPGSAPFLSPAFTASQVPPSAPNRHGAAAGAQEVTIAGSGGEGGGGAGDRGSGAARPGGAVTPSPTAGPEAGVPGVGRPARGLGRVCAPGEGPAGSWSLASPRPAGPGAWKAGGHRQAPLAGLLVRADFSLVASSRSLGDVKLGNFWVSCKHVDFLVKCFS